MSTATITTASSRITLVTGGSRGLGRSAALHLARRGSDLIITYRQGRAEAEQTLAELHALGVRAVALPLDLSQPAQIPAFVQAVQAALREHWQREQLDALVNNAGMGVHAPVADTSEAQFDQLVNVHLKGVFFLTQGLLPLLTDGGSILNVSSGLARFSLPGYAAYAMMKGGIEVFTRYLAQELGPRRIRVNTLAPGAIATDFGGGAVRDNPQVNQMVASSTALGRVGEADDIGKLAAALLSDDTGWVNAQRVEASGGVFI